MMTNGMGTNTMTRTDELIKLYTLYKEEVITKEEYISGLFSNDFNIDDCYNAGLATSYMILEILNKYRVIRNE